MIQCVGAATAMHDILAWGVADPGDGILTSRPVYGRFELDFGNKSQVRVVYADTDAENSFDKDVVDRFEEALAKSKETGVDVKMVLIVNPNNPLGNPESSLYMFQVINLTREMLSSRNSSQDHAVLPETPTPSIQRRDLRLFRLRLWRSRLRALHLSPLDRL